MRAKKLYTKCVYIGKTDTAIIELLDANICTYFIYLYLISSNQHKVFWRIPPYAPYACIAIRTV